MRRYSALFFLRQGLKSFWRNGVMSFASVAVLTSCLVVMGSFLLLVFNINSNIDSLGELNIIKIFVDTELPSAVSELSVTTAEQAQQQSTDQQQTNQEQAQEQTSPASLITLPAGKTQDDTAAIDGTSFAVSCNALKERALVLEGFTALAEAVTEASELRAGFDTLEAYVYFLPDGEEKNADAEIFLAAKEIAVPVLDRVSGLFDIKSKVEALGVHAELITSESALETQKEKYADYPELFEDLVENPLPDSFVVTYDSVDQADALEYDLNHLDGRIYKVEYRSEVTAAIENIRSVVILVFTWFLVILFVVSFFIIINTIKLSVFSRRDEISVMCYVGATDFFVTMPFLTEGVLIGILAATVGFFAQKGLYAYIVSLVADLQIVTILPFHAIQSRVFLGFLAVGILTGVLGSCISLRRYLKD